jgi:2-polyprenyl-3-methyl-5-hydroxy-6-metoxy-1,4-benzoquinol methylase
MENCKICGNKNDFFASAKLLNKYDVNYFQCSSCGFVQTEKPYWLDEAYSSAIADADVGLITRNIQNRTDCKKILDICFPHFFNMDGSEKPIFLDYAGGYGIFVRMMRDLGYDFYWYDKYCKGIFVYEHYIADMQKKYQLLTAFEFMEHIHDPLFELKQLFKLSGNIIFSTELIPKGFPKPNEWWYYALSSGQHISFYTKKSLEFIADKFGKKYVGNNSLHIFFDKKFSSVSFKFKVLMLCVKIAREINRIPQNLFFRRQKSLLGFDYEKIKGQQ